MGKKKCFVIGPIGEDGSDERKNADRLLEYIIRPSVPESYKVTRADEMTEPGIITQQIIDSIRNSDLIIADLHGVNPNVMYELSIAHVIKIPTILIYGEDDFRPFDIGGLRSYRIKMDEIENTERCKNFINKAIEAIEKNPDEIKTPFSMSVDLEKIYTTDEKSGEMLSALFSEIRELKRMMRIQLKSNVRRRTRIVNPEILLVAILRKHPSFPEHELMPLIQMAVDKGLTHHMAYEWVMDKINKLEEDRNLTRALSRLVPDTITEDTDDQ